MILLTVAACGDDGGGGTGGAAHSLTFEGSEYAPHDGQTLEIRVVDTADDSVVQSDMTTIQGGSVSFTWPDILDEGHSYEVRWFVDVNANGICNNPPEDHSWSSAVAAVTADKTVTHVHTTDVVPVCTTFGDFDLTFTGSDFAPHDGQTFKAAVLASDNSIVARAETTVAAGTFSLSWPSLLVTGQNYKVRFFVDVNGNGACDAPPTDHVWEATIGNVTSAKTFNYPHDSNLTDVCATFP